MLVITFATLICMTFASDPKLNEIKKEAETIKDDFNNMSETLKDGIAEKLENIGLTIKNLGAKTADAISKLNSIICGTVKYRIFWISILLIISVLLRALLNQ